jgi:hypothetical protein
MSRKKKAERPSVSDELGEAEVLSEAGRKRLEAAHNIARADAIIKSRRHQEEPEPEEEGSEDVPAEFASQPEPQPEPEMSKMDRILERIAGEGKFEVYKCVAGVDAKIGIFPISDYPDRMDTVAREHGGGTYKLVFKDRGGLIRGQDSLTYDPKAYRKEDSPAAVSDNMSRMFEMMEKREQALQLEIASLRREQTAMMMKMLEGKATESSRSADEMLMLLKAAREFAPKSPTDSMKELLEVASLFRESPVVEPQSPIQTAIDKAFTMLTPLLAAWAKKLGSAPGQPGGPLSLPAPGPGQGAPVQVSPAGGPPPTSPAHAASPAQPDPRLAQYAASLFGAVSAKQTPETIGQTILDLVPDEDLEALKAMVTDPAFAARLIAIEPRLKEHQAWLASLCLHIQSNIVEEAEEEPQASVPGTVTIPVEADKA